MTFLISLIMLATLPAQSQPIPLKTAPIEKTYCNERFAFCAQFPDLLFSTQTDLENGNGILLRTENDLASVTIAGYPGFQGKDTQDIFSHELKKRTGEGEQSVIISSLFGEDFYECFFLIDTRSYFHKAYLYNGKMILVSIETTINQPKLMQELRGAIRVDFPEKTTTEIGLSGREE